MNWYTQKKVTLREKKEKVRKFIVSTSFRVMLVVFIAFFGFLYVWQTNSVSTKGYAITDIEGQIRELNRENRSLQVKIAKNRSMQSIEERLDDMNLVAVNDIDYLTDVGNTVAQR